MNSFIKSALAATALVAAAAPAVAATPVTFDLTGKDTQTYGDMKNALTFSTQVGGVTYSVQATAWERDGSGNISQAHLGAYAGGLGSTNADDQNGIWNQHTIDNLHGEDFIALQFDRAVTLTAATLNAYPLMLSLPLDTDATYSHATSSTAWNGTLGMTPALLAALATNAISVAGNGTSGSVTMNQAGASGNLWIIGADMSGIDCTYDGFKLSSVSVKEQQPAVPEPATWATMLVGFGAVGAAMRRRTARVAQAV